MSLIFIISICHLFNLLLANMVHRISIEGLLILQNNDLWALSGGFNINQHFYLFVGQVQRGLKENRAAGEPYNTQPATFRFITSDDSLNPSCSSTLGIADLIFLGTCSDSQPIILCCANRRAIIKDSVGKGVSLVFYCQSIFLTIIQHFKEQFSIFFRL